MGNSFLAEISPNLDRLLQMDRLPTGTAAALAVDPAGTHVLVGDSGSILRLPAGFQTQSGILGIADSASTTLWPFVSPGAFVSVYGIQLGPSPAAGTVYDQPGHIATSLGGVTVSFDGIPASLTYAGNSQVNAIVPFGISGQTSTVMRLKTSSGFSQTVTLPVLAATPFVFNYAQNVTNVDAGVPTPAQFGAALNQDGSINSAANPARAGSIVSIFCNGAGVFTPALQDGTLTGVAPASPQLPVSIYFRGEQAEVLYAGQAPGLAAGVLQVNFRVGR